MGCGKGGDLIKWGKARVKEFFGVGKLHKSAHFLFMLKTTTTPPDIAAVSVDQAHQRWETMSSPKFDAHFASLDCYTEPLSMVFPTTQLEQLFDVVSMQFCMHYAFESASKVQCMLSNVSRWLRSGGVFIGTIPNAEQLLYVTRMTFNACPPLIPSVVKDWTTFLKMRKSCRLVTLFTKYSSSNGRTNTSLVTSTGFIYKTPSRMYPSISCTGITLCSTSFRIRRVG